MRIGHSLLLVILCLATAQAAHAELVTMVSSPIGDSWQYDFTIHNDFAPGSFAYGLTITDTASELSIVDPGHFSDWLAFDDPHSPAWINTNPPEGVAWGDSLSGFVITSTQPLAGNWQLWIDPTGNNNPDEFVSRTGLIPNAGVPEPTSLSLLGLAMGPVLLFGRRRRARLGCKQAA